MTVGDRRNDGDPKYPWGKWPKIDPASVAPLKNGKPNMYDHHPTRFVSLNESKARGWDHFWTGEPCPAGHRAARYVSNPAICVDCQRIKKGKPKVYTGGVEELEKRVKRNYTMKHTQSIQQQAQPTAAEKRFLEEYAKTHDFAKAASECNRTEAEFLAILSWNTTFREAVNRLEESLGIARTQKITAEFDWDDEKRQSFLYTYANTADLKQSMRSVGCTNVQFHKELTSNEEFHREFDEAAEMAKTVFSSAADVQAVQGRGKLLERIVANQNPEKYGESTKIDLNLKGTMTVEQQNAELAALISGLSRQGVLTARTAERIAGPEVVDAEYSLVESSSEDETDRNFASETADLVSDPNSDLVSGPE
jgi:hypothetical protein